jgi:hypothetical protein
MDAISRANLAVEVDVVVITQRHLKGALRPDCTIFDSGRCGGSIRGAGATTLPREGRGERPQVIPKRYGGNRVVLGMPLVCSI